MENQLYVSNLSQAATMANLRVHFSAYGEVRDVAFVAERRAQSAAPSAFVTMSTPAAAEHAARRLNGTLFIGRKIAVSAMQSCADEPRSKRVVKSEAAHDTAITQQYRERWAMIYELDCGGVRLTLRVFFPPEDGSAVWRIEAKTNAEKELSVEKHGPTRELALEAVAQAWQSPQFAADAPALDWPAVTCALRAVRAI